MSKHTEIGISEGKCNLRHPEMCVGKQLTCDLEASLVEDLAETRSLNVQAAVKHSGWINRRAAISSTRGALDDGDELHEFAL